jgi:secretion/DNA translocation related CpaE-like protein
VKRPFIPSSTRPLVITADEGLLDDLLRLAAAAGVEIDVAPDAGAARSRWPGVPLVVVGDDQAAGVSGLHPSRRPGVVLVGNELDDAGLWKRGVLLGAEDVVVLPKDESLLAERFADAAEGGGRDALVVGVVGGRGGAGASVLAAALAITSSRQGLETILVDVDPLGGGIDLVLGAEDTTGLRWPDFAQTRGRLGSSDLSESLPERCGLTVLSWDRGDLLTVPGHAVSAVIDAARRACDVVVLDLPRRVDEAAEEALTRSSCSLLVVPAEVRAVAAAARVAAGLTTVISDLRVVVRRASRPSLAADEVADALGLPLAVDMEPEPRLDEALERGEPPGRSGRGPLAAACARLLDDLSPASGSRAA